MRHWSVELADEPASCAFAQLLARAPITGCYIALSGPLGAGKTTLVRAMLRALGVEGPVRSPTYTLLEPYETSLGPLVHLDLYRLGDPEELEYLGIRDCFDANGICVVEWPERGEAGLPTPDIAIAIAFHGNGRRLALEAGTATGEAILQFIASAS